MVSFLTISTYAYSRKRLLVLSEEYKLKYALALSIFRANSFGR